MALTAAKSHIKAKAVIDEAALALIERKKEREKKRDSEREIQQKRKRDRERERGRGRERETALNCFFIYAQMAFSVISSERCLLFLPNMP